MSIAAELSLGLPEISWAFVTVLKNSAYQLKEIPTLP
jgi:hypothetical protein